LDLMLSPSSWKLYKAQTVRTAVAQLRRSRRIPVVLCERDLWPGSWKEVLQQTQGLSDPPFLIVASRFADERFWAEALNLGAYDVLAKPFDAKEVNRTLTSAWMRWRTLQERSTPVLDEVRFASGM
jgi:DNA-binding NtrC family response regulator